MVAYKYVVYNADHDVARPLKTADFYDEFDYRKDAIKFAKKNIDKNPIVLLQEVDINDFGEVSSVGDSEIIWRAQEEQDNLNEDTFGNQFQKAGIYNHLMLSGQPTGNSGMLLKELLAYLDSDSSARAVGLDSGDVIYVEVKPRGLFEFYMVNDPTLVKTKKLMKVLHNFRAKDDKIEVKLEKSYMKDKKTPAVIIAFIEKENVKMPAVALAESDDIHDNEDAHKYDYMLLSRLQQDCEYFLGHGDGHEKHLWAGNVEDQIAKMRELYDELPEKPEWLSINDIDDYEEKMLYLKNAKVEEAVCKDYKVITHPEDDEKILDESAIDYNKLREELEEHEDEVECQECFDLVEKKNAVKTDNGYVCLDCQRKRDQAKVAEESDDELDTDNEVLDLMEGLEEEDALLELDESEDEEELPESNADVVSILSALVQDEWEAITGYSDAIAKIEKLGLAEEAEIKETIADIVGEENIHIGQLSQLIKKYDPTFELKQQEGKDHDEEHSESDEDFPVDESLVESEAAIGDVIRIISMEGEDSYTGKEGEITSIDDLGQLHGTWGGLAVIPDIDKFEIIEKNSLNEDYNLDKVKEILKSRVTSTNEIKPYSDSEKLPRGFMFKSGTTGQNQHGIVSFNGKDYAYAVKDGEVTVMSAEEAGSNWSETILKESYEALNFFKKLISKYSHNKDFIRRAAEDIYYVDEVAPGAHSITELNDDELAQLEGYVHNVMVASEI